MVQTFVYLQSRTSVQILSNICSMALIAILGESCLMPQSPLAKAINLSKFKVVQS